MRKLFLFLTLSSLVFSGAVSAVEYVAVLPGKEISLDPSDLVEIVGHNKNNDINGYPALCGGDITKLQQAVGHSEGTTVTARHYLNSVPVDHGKDYFDHRNLSKAFMKEWSSRDKDDVMTKPFGESRGTLDQVRRVKNITEDPEDKIFDM